MNHFVLSVRCLLLVASAALSIAVLAFQPPANKSTIRLESSGLSVGRYSDIHFAFSPDGSRFVYGKRGADTAMIVDTRTLKVVRHVSHEGVVSAAWLPDGKSLVFGLESGEWVIYNIDSGLFGQRGKSNPAPIFCIKPSRDGARIFTGDIEGDLVMSDLRTGKVLRAFDGHTKCVNDIVLSSDESRLASVSDDKTIRVWDASSGRVLGNPLSTAKAVQSLALSPDGTQFIAGDSDGVVCLHRFNADANVIRTYLGFPREEFSYHFSPDGTQIVAVYSERGNSRTIDVVTGAVTSVEPVDAEGARFLSERRHYDGNTGLMVVFGDTRTSLADTKDWKDVVEVPAPSKIETAGFVAGGKWIMHVGPDRKLIVAAIGGKTSKIEIKEDMPFGYTFGDGVALSPSPSSRIAFGTLGDGRGVVVDPRTNAVQRRLVDPSESDYSWDSMMQMAPAGDRAYSAGSDSKIRVWDVSSGRLIRRLAGHKAEVNSVSPDATGTRLATGSDDKTAKIWDLKSGKVIRSFLCSGKVVWASISPDGSLLVTRDSNSVKVWKISTGRRLREYLKATVAVWSGSGSELLLGGNDSLALIDVMTGVRKVKYASFGPGPVALSSASDGVLLTVYESGSVRLFDKKNGQELATIQYFQDGSWIANDSSGAYTTSAGAQVPQLTFMDSEGLTVLTSADPSVKAKYDPQLLERILKR